MPRLVDFEKLRDALVKEKKHNIALLHKFVFESIGDRENRKRLRSFEGFDDKDKDVTFDKKVVYVAEN